MDGTVPRVEAGDGDGAARRGRRAGGIWRPSFCCFVVSCPMGHFLLSVDYTAHFLGTHTQDTHKTLYLPLLLLMMTGMEPALPVLTFSDPRREVGVARVSVDGGMRRRRDSVVFF